MGSGHFDFSDYSIATYLSEMGFRNFPFWHFLNANDICIFFDMIQPCVFVCWTDWTLHCNKSMIQHYSFWQRIVSPTSSNIGKLCNVQSWNYLADTEAIEIAVLSKGNSWLFRHSYSMLAWQQYKFYPLPSLYQFEIMHTYTFSVETCLTLGEE